MATALRVSFRFFFDAKFMMPSFKNTASIFPEISFIQYFPLFCCKPYALADDVVKALTSNVMVTLVYTLQPVCSFVGHEGMSF